MSQRDSGLARIPLDAYETPAWATGALIPHLRKLVAVWEPACGSGKMVRALEAAGLAVIYSDIADGSDFLRKNPLGPPQRAPYDTDAIITNPPYTHATEFIERALELMNPVRGIVAMLLRCDFDHAKTRRHIFSNCSAFSKKIVLTKRVQWFEDSHGSPSFNHAWFLWDWRHEGAPTIAYDFQ